MVAIEAGPLEPDLLDPVVTDPRPERREIRELVPGVFGRRVLGPVGAQRLGEVDDDAPVLARVARARNRFTDAVYTPLGVRERSVLLREAGGREHDVRMLRARLVQEEVL